MIRVRAMPEFVHQVCVKLIGNGGVHRHRCALKPLSILNTGRITTFLPTSLSTFCSEKFKKMFKEVNETVKNIFSHICLPPDAINYMKVYTN